MAMDCHTAHLNHLISSHFEVDVTGSVEQAVAAANCTVD